MAGKWTRPGREGKGAANSGGKGFGNVLTNNYHIHEKFSNGSVNSPYEIFTITMFIRGSSKRSGIGSNKTFSSYQVQTEVIQQKQ